MIEQILDTYHFRINQIHHDDGLTTEYFANYLGPEIYDLDVLRSNVKNALNDICHISSFDLESTIDVFFHSFAGSMNRIPVSGLQHISLRFVVDNKPKLPSKFELRGAL